MLENGRWSPTVLLQCVLKGPSQFPNVFLITTYQDALTSTLPNFLGDRILVLGIHQKGMDGIVSAEVNLSMSFILNLFETLTEILSIRYH